MAYANFIPEVWNESILRNLERLCVFAEDCNRQYEGDVKGPGDTVHILGAATPQINTINRSLANSDIGEPQELEGTDDMLTVNQMAYFNYMVGDIDKAQAVPALMDSLSAETSEGIANVIDRYIASFAVDEKVPSLYDEAALVTAEKTDSGIYVLKVLDDAIQRLYENDVKQNTEIVVTVSPRFYTLFRSAYIDRNTNNSEIMKNGKVGMYGNVTIKMSNNVCTTNADGEIAKDANGHYTGAIDNIMIRTKRALAFVNPFTKTEAYRPERHFADAVKGYSLYDAKVIRPQEILNINVKYTADNSNENQNGTDN